MTVSTAAMSVFDYATHFIALFSDYQIQSLEARLQPITMDTHPVTVPKDNDVVTQWHKN